MTKQDIPRNSSIDRRTVLGLLSGSLAALAGCSGGLSDSSDGDGGSAGPPEEQSDYIEETSIEIVENGRQLALEVAVTDEIEPHRLASSQSPVGSSPVTTSVLARPGHASR